MDNQEDNTVDQNEQIRALLEQSKQTILDVKNSSDNAKQILSNIEDYSKRFEELRSSIEDPVTGINAYNTRSKNTKEEIDALKKSSDDQLAEIKANIASIHENIRLMNDAYASFEQINLKVNDSENGMSPVLLNAKNAKEQIDAFRVAADDQLAEIKVSLTVIQEYIRLMNDAYASFEQINLKVNDSENGLLKKLELSETTKQEIIAVKKQSDSLFQEIKKFRDESQGYTKEIEEAKMLSEESKNSILKYENESNDLKLKIEKIYQIATDRGLANSFDKRKEELNTSTTRWFRALILATVTLLVILIVFLWSVDSINAYTWYRLTLTSPIIFFITFASIQYSKERSLLEKYAFKSVTAVALEAYTTLLINTFGKEKEKNEQEILNFVLTSMSIIYQEPHDARKESKFSLGIDGNFSNLRADFTETMQETKKDIVRTVKEEMKKTSQDEA